MYRYLFMLLMLMLVACQSAPAGVIYNFSDPSGLSAEAEFTLLSDYRLEIRLKNTSTGVPIGFDNSDQLLTSVSWDMGAPGKNNSDPWIDGGKVLIGPDSQSVNFDKGSYGPGYDVSGEYGYGNRGTTGMLPNLLSAMRSHTVKMGNKNLDGPKNISGPQAGLISSAFALPLGGLGAIEDEIIARIHLEDCGPGLFNLDFLDNGVRFEFGRDAAFFDGTPDTLPPPLPIGTVPEPATLTLGALGLMSFVLLCLRARRRRQ